MLFRSPREPLSLRFAVDELGVAESQVRLVPDSVFGWIEPDCASESVKQELAAQIGGSPYFCVTIRAGMSEEDAHLTSLAGAIRDTLQQNEAMRCVIVTHCHPFDGYPGFEDDRQISKKLVDAVDCGSRVVLVSRALSPSQLIAIYRSADFVVGMRLHSVILSIVAGTPVLAISYWGNKTYGIMQMAGLEHLVFDFRNLDRQELVRAMRRLADNLANERATVCMVRDRLHREANETPNFIREAWLAT